MEPVNIAIEGQGDNLPPLLLRPPGPADVTAVAELFNDPQTSQWSLVPKPFTEAHAKTFLEIARRDWNRDSPRWLICDADGSKVLGTVALRRHPRQTWEVVFHTAPWARRRQVALRAVHAAVRFGFATLSARRLEWNAIVGNHLSRLIAIRLGFQLEGVARAMADQRGTRVDQWIGSLLPGELRELDDPPPDYDVDRKRALLFCGGQPSLDTAVEGLRLRPLHADDIELIVEACQDPETARWTTVPQPYERQHAEYFVDQVGAGSWRQGIAVIFALADAEDRFCGGIDLRLNSADKRVGEVGFSSAPWSRGRGYMTAALRAVCDFGFDSLDLERVEWKAFVGNVASRRVAEKAGFTMEGTLRSDVLARGERVDSWVAALLRGDR
ncbi:GNAT family N-acetyltransferase [Stackebrandtia nassauensis]|uniref:GCN5-related N-acetyltransferase n=1 Tax=Stackebrandtia nassauensis (strain DSM 44728 / CIP 108903 / NRRL B-16338 / NBRC 102104 / LLR-40K-21) TaxID=446470 RepID=D3PYI5_STANL|nr:GNAT family protein [Stackebrandtia nassauensis]ADD41552.1 GCN5-related N-acetyltransferase [Stackebrandtia nassauensis DSM 44728]